MSSTVKMLLLLLIQNLDSKTVYKVNKMLIDLLEEFTQGTATEVDDKIVDVVKKFLKLDNETL